MSFLLPGPDKPPEDALLTARAIFYEYDILRFPALAFTAMKRPSPMVIIECIELCHQWLKAFDWYCTERGGRAVTVGRRKRGDDTEEPERAERDFSFANLLSVYLMASSFHCCACRNLQLSKSLTIM